MKVSVIVPVYNVEKYLSKCLDSLANQTIDDYEVIVVNDCTPDNSQEIIDRYV
ncbi:MAG: glycosyltransferase, partial [Bacilli bacterium]|nr:glycosyltransferase [Bacilli bacterium]